MNVPDAIWDQLPGLQITAAGAPSKEPQQFLKSVSFTPGVVNAGVTYAANIPTYDDNLIRTVCGVWASVNTAGILFQVLSSGRLMSNTDHSLFSATAGPVPCFVPIAANTPVQVQIVNQTGSNSSSMYASLLYAVFDPKFRL